MADKISLCAARKNRKLTQGEVAKVLGVTEKTISSWETGKTFPNGAQFLILCNLYGRSADGISLP